MENQHRKITGYRELNQQEIDLMNEVKALGPQIEAVLLKVQAHILAQRKQISLSDTCSPDTGVELLKRLEDSTPERFAAMSKTEFQTGLMYLTRAVAQPTFF